MAPVPAATAVSTKWSTMRQMSLLLVSKKWVGPSRRTSLAKPPGESSAIFFAARRALVSPTCWVPAPDLDAVVFSMLDFITTSRCLRCRAFVFKHNGARASSGSGKEVADCQMGARRLLPQWPVGCAHRRHRPRYFADHEGCCFHEIVAHVGGERRSRSRSW